MILGLTIIILSIIVLLFRVENAIKKKDRLKPTVILGDAASGFSDPDFWGQYNLIEPDKSIEFAIQKIKKNTAKTAADNL